MISVKFIKSSNKKKKLRALFYEGKELIKQTDFGASGYSDYTIHQNDERKNRYIARHQKNENWEDPFSRGSLALFILWNKKTLEASIKDYVKRFGFKLI